MFWSCFVTCQIRKYRNKARVVSRPVLTEISRVYSDNTPSLYCVPMHTDAPGVVPVRPRSWPTACACGRIGAAGGNYCNLSTAGAGGICRGTINARSRWLWAGDEWMGASRVKKQRGRRRRNERCEAVRWSAERSHTWTGRSSRQWEKSFSPVIVNKVLTHLCTESLRVLMKKYGIVCT